MSRISLTSLAVIIILFSLLFTPLLSPLVSGSEIEHNKPIANFSLPSTKQSDDFGYDSNQIPVASSVLDSFIGPITGAVVPTTILGYHNLSEVNAKLFNIAQSHPTIAKVYDLGKLYPWPNGTPKHTVQNRTLYALKVSDNPGSNESLEPDILYMSLHHAREWISVEVVLYVLDYIINNYKTNTTLSNIINTTELWFVPVVNPDGFDYSQYGRDDINNTNSNQWRKNLNETNSNPGFQDYDWAQGDGVDLNRNYGYKWGYDNSGSSGNSDNQLYRGSAPFSEVETQIIRDFSLAMQFRLAISYHSYSQLILFPWSYASLDTPHDALFNEIAKNMSQYNNYQYGNPKDGVIYHCNGEADDWLYSNLTCLAFTFELGTVFIPPPNQILPICQKNLEPSLLIAKIADDPYKIFNSGITGRVTNTRGEPIFGVNITTTFATDMFLAETNSTGHYQLRLPPGSFGLHASKEGYWLRSLNVNVHENKFTTKDFTMIDSQPPVISAVWAEYDGIPGNSFSINSHIQLNVAEAFSEENLTGMIEINSAKQSYSSGEKSLKFDNSTGYYYYLWNTSKLLPGNDYVVEADLNDYDFNVDANGSNDTGPDLVLSLLDLTAPVVSAVDTLAITLPSGIEDSDERYELGANVRILVHEVNSEKWLNGTVRITSVNATYDSGVFELKYNHQEDHYYSDWSTVGLTPADDYCIETTLRDRFGNIDSDGLVTYPDIVVTLEDTTPPIITSVDSRVGADDDESYELGVVVLIILEVEEHEMGLNGYVIISSASTGYEISLSDLKYNSVSDYFYVRWDTTGLEVASDYVVEGRIADRYQNYDMDGSQNFAADLIIRLLDTAPPVVESVYSFVGTDQDNRYELGSEVWLVVHEAQGELNLTGTIMLSSSTLKYDSGIQGLTYNATLNGYVWVWNTSVKGIDIASDFEVETSLSDRFGNMDSDGLGPGPDLVIALDDTTPPEISAVWSKVGADTDNSYEAGANILLIISERYSEPELTGTIYIASPTIRYNSGVQQLVWEPINKYYTFTWSTIGLHPGEDYLIETTLTDIRGNSDSDGLPSSPDLIISLVDTTPPSPVTNLVAKQNQRDITKVFLTWNTTEPGAKLHIYRSTEPILNLTDQEPISTVEGDEFVDRLPPEAGKYYYVVIIEDSAGNLNTNITPWNSASVTIPELYIPTIDPDKAKQEKVDDDLWFWLVLVFLVILILVIISALYFVYFRRDENEDVT